MTFTRIFSDLHYGDRASRVRQLRQIVPLLDGPDRIIVNGDALDTRLGRLPERTRAMREEVLDFFRREARAADFITGNHDSDISTLHELSLADGAVFVTHGDVLYDDIVPWGRDVPLIRRLVAEERALLPPRAWDTLETKLGVIRRVAQRLPQRHQMEPNLFKYIGSFLADTLWPPDRALRILRTWKETPGRAAELLRVHRPAARFAVMGHFHRPGVWRRQNRVVINTGSFCPPLGGTMVDLFPDRLVVRQYRERGGDFRPDRVVAEFALPPAGQTPGGLHPSHDYTLAAG